MGSLLSFESRPLHGEALEPAVRCSSCGDWRHPEPAANPFPYDDPIVPDVTLLLIAYRYLAGCLDGLINEAVFDPIRDAIKSSALPQDGVWRVEPYWTRQPKPWHGLAIRETQPHLVVYVRLFADLIWLVHFEQIALKRDDCAP